jgi:hypothetical protein
MRVHFHLVNETQRITDFEGVDVANLDDARSEALRAIDEYLWEEALSPNEIATWRLEAVDVTGAVLFSVDLHRMIR